MVHCESRGAGLSTLSLQLQINMPNGPVGNCCVGGWVRPLADNTILHYFVRIGDWRGSTFMASNHKSNRATPGSFASVQY